MHFICGMLTIVLVCGFMNILSELTLFAVMFWSAVAVLAVAVVAAVAGAGVHSLSQLGGGSSANKSVIDSLSSSSAPCMHSRTSTRTEELGREVNVSGSGKPSERQMEWRRNGTTSVTYCLDCGTTLHTSSSS